MVFGIPISLGTIAALVSIVSGAGMVINISYDLANSGIEYLRSNTSIKLTNRCAIIAEILQSVDPGIIVTPVGRKLVQTLVDCIEWSKKYDKKTRIKKIFYYEKYHKRFAEYHNNLTQDLSDIAHSIEIINFKPRDSANLNTADPIVAQPSDNNIKKKKSKKSKKSKIKNNE